MALQSLCPSSLSQVVWTFPLTVVTATPFAGHEGCTIGDYHAQSRVTGGDSVKERRLLLSFVDSLSIVAIRFARKGSYALVEVPDIVLYLECVYLLVVYHSGRVGCMQKGRHNHSTEKKRRNFFGCRYTYLLANPSKMTRRAPSPARRD